MIHHKGVSCHHAAFIICRRKEDRLIGGLQDVLISALIAGLPSDGLILTGEHEGKADVAGFTQGEHLLCGDGIKSQSASAQEITIPGLGGVPDRLPQSFAQCRQDSVRNHSMAGKTNRLRWVHMKCVFRRYHVIPSSVRRGRPRWAPALYRIASFVFFLPSAFQAASSFG